jgi:hypothetical protein
MHAEPQQEHRWLDQLLGEWTYESEGACGPGEAPAKAQGAEHRVLTARVEGADGTWRELMTAHYRRKR